MWLPQLKGRCPSATVIGPGELTGWRAVYDKPSVDGSAKLNIRPHEHGVVEGVLYEIEDSERRALDTAEPRYEPVILDVDGSEVLSYTWTGEPFSGLPYEWYASMVAAGASSQGFEPPSTPTRPDPLAPGLKVTLPGDLAAIQRFLSARLADPDLRFKIHPGDLAWWTYHADPRWNLTMWRQGDSGVLILEESRAEISVFTKPGVSRNGLIEWAQRRLGGMGEVAWVADRDSDLIEYLKREGYSAVHTERDYQWDLTKTDIPQPGIPEGWSLRPLSGENEADSRRGASHAAFESTLEPARHLDRYLTFMRSPVYNRERDLVAVTPEGRVAAFMVWWSDRSGVAQIEPFGTHPEFQRQGVGRALIHYGLRRMRDAGMKLIQVGTDEQRVATSFYEGVGFTDVGRVRWWKKVA